MWLTYCARYTDKTINRQYYVVSDFDKTEVYLIINKQILSTSIIDINDRLPDY